LVFKPEFSWEFLSAEEIQAKSIRALRNHVKHTEEVSPYYRELFSSIDVNELQTIDDFQKLPLTDKDTLSTQPGKFISVEPSQIVETVITSGSAGKPLAFPLTVNDLDRLAFNEALSFHSAGVTADDRVQILVSLDRLFIAGMAYYRGLVLLGANTMRLGVVPNDMHKYYFESLKPTVLVGVPSYLNKLAIELGKQGFDPKSTGVKKIFCIGESLRNQDMELNSVAVSLETLWGAKVYSTYASTEMSVSYCECEDRTGGHSHPELIFTEILDESGKPVPDGTPGELVVTPLGVEGVPLVRFKTGDITFKISQTCSCGRNSLRIGPILGRKSQMIKLKGTTVYPLTLTNALDGISEINDYVIILENNDALSDNVAVHVAAPPSAVEKIANQLRAVARVNFPVLISNITTIESYRGKSRKKIRIIDWRQQAK
jgi:phenylacetate-CoA ligase